MWQKIKNIRGIRKLLCWLSLWRGLGLSAIRSAKPWNTSATKLKNSFGEEE